MIKNIVSELQPLVINSKTSINTVFLIDLPVIDTKDGPFRSVNNRSMCLFANLSLIIAIYT